MKGILTNTTIGNYGRFANGMFQLAGLIGIARKHGFDWQVPKFINHDHKERFGSTEPIDIYNHLANELPEWNGVHYPERHFNWGYHEVQLPAGNWDLIGHFQSFKYFSHAIDEVRHYLTFKDEPEQNDYVAVHFRAGDYTEGVEGHHPRCTLEYYDKAMQLFPVGTRFLLFSDDSNAALDRFAPLSEKYQIRMAIEGDYIKDFKLMKKCASFICANSSYSFMAALLATHPDKKIIMPSRWFGNAWPDPEGMQRDLYPEGAVVI